MSLSTMARKFDTSDLRCVECGDGEILAGENCDDPLRCSDCQASYPVVDGIPSLVPRGSALARPAASDDASAALDDGVQARYWASDEHGFRSPHHPIVEYFSRQRWRSLASRLDLDGVRTALDVGCGDGFSSLYVPSHVQVTACDGSLTMLRRHAGSRRLHVDAFALPFRQASFDLVFAWELLHHVSEPHRVLSEMARVSRKWVVCCEPNPLNPAQALFAIADPAHRWVLRFSRRYMMREIERAGLLTSHFFRGGCIFPNKTPRFLFPLLRLLPYRLPIVGITNVLVARSSNTVTPGLL